MRHDQMQDPSSQAAGWPLGSGTVESANTLVVAARLTGMRWERSTVNALLVFRDAVCHDRWQESWQTAHTEQQQRRYTFCQHLKERAAMRVQKCLVRMMLRYPRQRPTDQDANQFLASPPTSLQRTN
jgi:hypothetical protein